MFRSVGTRAGVLTFACSALLFATSACADRFDAARALIHEQLVDQQLASIAVAVVKDGKIVWQQGFGWADKERRVPASEHTMYSLASLSKTFTSTALMTLVQAGKVDLDRPVNDYLGELQLKVRIGDERQVTVRRVADHTAGLPGADLSYYGDERQRMLPQELSLQRYAQVMRPPGERFEYSNVGYGVLDYLVAQVSGRSFAEAIRQNVSMPLGMTRTSVDIGPGLQDYAAVRYDLLGEPIPFYQNTEPGATAVYSSAHDLARFALLFLKSRLPDQQAILSDASIDAMTATPTWIRPGNGYAIGWQVQSKGGYRVHGHGGSHSGANAFFNLIPEQRVGVILLSNTNKGPLDAIGTAIFKALLPGWRDVPTDLSVREKPPTEVLQPEAFLVGAWKGEVKTHEGAHALRMQVLPTGDIHLQLDDQLSTLLNQAAFRNGRLTGRSSLQIDTSDTRRRAHDCDITLHWRDGMLNGYIHANAKDSQRGWWIYSLPHWVELRREQ